MRKRRVLALFLALSMALSSNGFTTLAAEQDPTASIEAGLSEGTDETDGENIASDANDENGNDASESEEGAHDNTGKDGDTSEGGSDVSDGGDSSENNDGTGDNNVSSDENVNTEDGNTESNGNNGNEDDALSEDEGEGGSGVGVSDETDVLDDAEPEKDVQIVDEGLENTGCTEVRMYTFTDETGMAVTYDLNEESTYVYTVENHVLKNVVKADGEKLSGTVELKQRTNSVDDSQYYTEIDASVFSGNTDIEYVILPDGVETIGADAFTDCEKLKSVSLPKSLAVIGDRAFKNCKKMTQLSIPKSVISIGDSAFINDSHLFMVYIKDSAYSKMRSIGANAFKECRSLEKFGSDTEFVLPGYLETIGASAFEECRSIKKVTLPYSVKEKKNSDGTISPSEVLGIKAFKNCIKMTDLVLSGVSVIPEEAFSGCENLISVKFENGNKEIRTSAFEGCSILSELVLPSSISTIWDNAFKNCGKLSYVEIQNPAVEFKSVEFGAEDFTVANDRIIIANLSVFPTNNEVWIKVNLIKDSSLATYLETHSNNIKVVSDEATKSALFKCEYLCLTTVSATSVVFTEADRVTHISAKGVKAGTKIYVCIKKSSSVNLIEGSLRCNGTPIGKDNEGEYTFNMPVGGAYVTAEYEGSVNGVNNNINGYADDVEFDLSNGNEIREEAGKVSKSYELKVGQTSRMFLIDTSAGADNSVIDSSKIKFATDNKTIATVSKDGVIKALKKGTARITATVNDRNGNPTSRQAVIKISSADVLSLKLKPVSYDSSIINVDTQKDSEDGEEKVVGVSISKNYVESKETTFTLLATAYDSTDSSGDNMSAALKWKSSDSKVAKLAKSSTTEAESQNMITIPVGAKGDATITVTATNANPVDADYKTVVAKFSIHVLDNTPRIASSSLVLNPYQTTGAEFEIVGAYGSDISNAKVEIRKYPDTTAPSAEFILTTDKNETVSSVCRCHVRSIIDEMKDGAYKESIHIEIGGSVYDLPITVNVKRFKPDPTVKFAKNQAKVNLFYANDDTEVVPVISNLGNTKIKSYRLENLSKGVDDLHFMGNGSDIAGNFQINEETGIITRLNDEMYYTSKKKPVVTGYLVLTFEDYKEDYKEKKYKITIPTKTTKPSYKLERSSDTFSLLAGPQDGVTLALLDSKTKTPIDLSDGDWEVTMDSTSTSSAVAPSSVDTTADGKITMDVNPNGGGGKIVLAVRNNTWDASQVLKYKYTVKISSKRPTFKLSKSTVSLSRYFATEQTEKVSIKSNQCGVEAGNPNFEPQNYEKLSKAKKEQYSLIDVGQWNPDTKEVSVTLLNSDIKTGTYKFVGYPYGDDGNKVTLTVKVTGTAPALTIKGSASLNRSADNADTATLTLNIKNCPSDCKIDADSTSTIECVTKKASEEGIESEFAWNIEDNKLKVSLQKDADVYNKTYTFKMTPKYTIGDSSKSKPVKFKVKVYQKAITISLKAKGKINLLERKDGSIENTTPNMSVASDMIVTTTNNDALMIDTKAVVSYSEDGNTAEPTGTGGEVTDPIEHTVTLTKPTRVDTLEYAVINADASVEDSTEFAKVSDSGELKIETGKRLAIKVTPEIGCQIKQVTASMGESGSEEPLNISDVVGKDNIYISDPIDAAVKVTIEAELIDYTIEITNNAGDVVTTTEYKIGDAAGYSEYDYNAAPNLTAHYGAPLTLRLTVDRDKLDVGESIVVKYAKGTDGTQQEQVLSRKDADAGDTAYNYVIDEVTDNIRITISTAEAHKVTLPTTLPKGVSGISYCVIESSANIESDTAFAQYDVAEAATPIPVASGYKLALKVTPEENYTITSVKNAADNLSEVKVGEDTVYVLDNVEADAVIAIEAAKVNTAKFVKYGSHATIKPVGADAAEIPNNGTDTFVSGGDYKFVVETQTGYGVDVKVYKKADYDSAIADNRLPNDVIEPVNTEGNTYTISKDAIGTEAEDIVIVITDIYTITIANDAGVAALKCKVGDAAGYTNYDSSNKPTALYGKAVLFSFTLAEGTNIAVMNGDEQMSPDSSSTATDPIYSINAVEDNVNITILTTYEIDEDIQKNANNNLTAQIVFDSSVKTDNAGKHIVLQGNELSFTVKPKNGYDISEVGYKLTAAEGDAFTALDQPETVAEGKKYTIQASNVTANITIVVKTQETDEENWTVAFDVRGAKVQTGTAAATSTPAPIKIARTATGEARTIKFNVEKIEENKLRYVGTDETGKIGELAPLDNAGNYQYTLPESPEPVTTIYVKATPLAQNSIAFTGLTENSITKATASMVTFSPDNTAITTMDVDGSGVAAGTYDEDTVAYFMVTPTAEYMQPIVKINGTTLMPETYKVKVNTEETERQVSIYKLNLTNVFENVTIDVTVASVSQGGDDEPSYGYTLTNSIVYTPVVSNLKDTIIDAKIFDAAGAAPDIEKSEESDYFNIDVDVKKGLLYVTPKPDLSEDVYLKNNTTYKVKIWLQFEKYQPDANAGGVWVDKIINIKTAQVLPKVTTETKTINLYQSNTEYEASFNVSLKGNTNAVVTGISFGDKDQKAQDAFELSDPIKQSDGSYRFTIKLSGQAIYANNSTNKIKMYVQFENQAKDTLGTPITMNIRING